MTQTHYWPGEDEPGEYIVELSTHAHPWNWTGKTWEWEGLVRDRKQMIEAGYLGVRVTEKPTSLADEAEAAFRACKKPYEFERWALAYGPKLIAAARGMA